MTWGSSVLSEHGQIKKKVYDCDQEFDAGCTITKKVRHPNGTRFRINLPLFLLSGLTESGA